MVKALCKNPLFLTGFLFLFILFISSIIHTFVFDSYIPEKDVLYEDGQLAASSPLTPADYPPLGTNNLGESLFYKVLLGAKWTIGIAFLVAIFRMMISFVLGIFYGQYLMRFNQMISKIAESFHYVPMALLAYLLLEPVLMEQGAIGQFEYSFGTRVIFEVVILTVIALPTTTLKIGSDMTYILRQAFITGAEVMGASRFHILKKHIMPHLAPKLWIQFAQQVIQVLIILVHLGLLQLFFGGTDVGMGPGGTTFTSLSGEWSGLIGKGYQYLEVHPWIPLTPLVMFALAILAMNFVLEGLKSASEPHHSRRKTTVNNQHQSAPDAGENAFAFVRHNQTHQG
ncbi:ABC transporter permease [Tuberibacillus sp. Marseille-P3662]|uniref:ABC transporter permease n=1 Tax=Tuberibacillus sp. Marseille-P3662 TaxID=1965358 RepID=UPI000A1CA89D|nr:ABC transporter permease subunit [Tuberibacillus sp. Marseille-P3662]